MDQGEQMLVWGDFDVDGQTSTSLLVAALRKLAGEERVHYHVPNRFTEGHGIRVEKLARSAGQTAAHRPHADVRHGHCRCCRQSAYAKDQGMTVVVTDHHDLTVRICSR